MHTPPSAAAAAGAIERPPPPPQFNCYSKMCMFNHELFRPLNYIDEWKEWSFILSGRLHNVKLAYISVNLLCFWAEFCGSAFALIAYFQLGLTLKLFGRTFQAADICLLAVGVIGFAYVLAYILYFMVHVVQNVGAVQNARKVYLVYGCWNAVMTAICGYLSIGSGLLFLGPTTLFGFKTVFSWLCASFCIAIEAEMVNGMLVVQKVVLQRTETGTVTSEVVTGERFDLCDRLCRFHVELFSPFKNIDSWREWKAIFSNRPKNVRLAYLSMNLVSLWSGVLGTSTAMLFYATLDYVLEIFEPMDALVRWEIYWAVLVFAYVVAYALYLVVNLGATLKWLRVAQLAYIVCTVVYAALAATFAWGSSHHFLFGVPATCYAITTFANAMCVSFVSKLMAECGSTSML